jgi:hypothetical protein
MKYGVNAAAVVENVGMTIMCRGCKSLNYPCSAENYKLL